MQKSTSSTGTYIFIIVIVVISLLAYFYYRGNPTDSTSSLLQVSEEAAGAKASSDRVLVLLSKMRSIKIKTEIFDSPLYKSLVDYTITVPPQPIGRTNPFAPAGSGR